MQILLETSAGGYKMETAVLLRSENCIPLLFCGRSYIQSAVLRGKIR